VNLSENEAEGAQQGSSSERRRRRRRKRGARNGGCRGFRVHWKGARRLVRDDGELVPARRAWRKQIFVHIEHMNTEPKLLPVEAIALSGLGVHSEPALRLFGNLHCSC